MVFFIKGLALVFLSGLVTTSCTDRKEERSYRSITGVKDLEKAAAGDSTKRSAVGFSLIAERNLLEYPVTDMKVRLICNNLEVNHQDQRDIDLLNGGKFEIYGEPEQCTLQLLSFVSDNRNFSPDGGATGRDFISHLANDTAVFTDGLVDINVKVVQQLPSPVTGDFTVIYNISEVLQEDADFDLDIVFEDISAVIQNEPAPQLNVRRAKVVALNPLMPGFEIYVQCLTPVTSNTYDASKCAGKPLNEMLAVFKEMDEGFQPIVRDLNLLFADNADPAPQKWDKVGSRGFDFLEPGPVLPNGGVKFKVPFVELGLTKLNELNGKKFILAVKHEEGISYFVSTLKKRPRPGCTDETAFNFDHKATEDDESCIYPPACADLTTFDPNAPWDNDCDGVPDMADTCDETFENLEVNESGCSNIDLADSDNDGVLNYKDMCFSKVPVDVSVNGCSFEDNQDDDSDGIVNHLDKCGATPFGTPVDSATGCKKSDFADFDGDGVPNGKDDCSGTFPGDEVDAAGCLVASFADGDSDGVPDSRDKCVGTPTGEVVAGNGCGISDLLGSIQESDVIGSLGGKVGSVNGVASYAIPLEFPGGTHGMAPSVSCLLYTSDGCRRRG